DLAVCSVLIHNPHPVEVLRCLECRQIHFINFPEPIPIDVRERDLEDGRHVIPRVTTSEARKEYCLTNENLRPLLSRAIMLPQISLTPDRPQARLFLEQTILEMARQIHGGDVGLRAA
ncbi:hypothetical protein BGX30_005628, partial [Mortierella sp. GBA39]